MANKKDDIDNIIMEAMPGGEPLKEEDTKFEVDLNFDDVPQEEETDEEVSEEVNVAPEEEVVEEEVEQQGEEEESSEPEAVSEESVDGESEGTPQPGLQSIEGSNENVTQEVNEQKAPMVPKSRLDEVLAKQKALQKQLDEMNQAKQQQLENAPEYDFASKEAEYQELVLNGEAEKAVSLRNEIRAAEKEQFMFEVQQKMGQTVQQSQEMTALQEKATQIENTYSVLNENSADFDADLQAEVISLRDAFMVQGYTPADALERATNYTLAAKQPNLLQPKATQQAPKVDQKVQETKKVANINKKLAASESQPPEMKGEGARGDKKIELHKLSEDEFAALPEETLRRLRGDFGT
jgi:hypothetical protein